MHASFFYACFGTSNAVCAAAAKLRVINRLLTVHVCVQKCAHSVTLVMTDVRICPAIMAQA